MYFDYLQWHTWNLMMCMHILETTRKLPVERAKDAVCFFEWCGVSLVSSAIIYNTVKVKVTH